MSNISLRTVDTVDTVAAACNHLPWHAILCDTRTLAHEDTVRWIEAIVPSFAVIQPPIILIGETPSVEFAELQVRLAPQHVLFAPSLETICETISTAVLTPPRRRGGPPQTILAIGAHPDDVEIAIGGLLWRHRQQRDHIILLIMTDGEGGGPRAKRLQEAEMAAAHLGADIHFGHLRDTMVGERSDAISIIEAIITRYQPTIVYTHSLADRHQDHRTVHQATMVASRSVPSVYGYQAPSSDLQFHPQTFVDVTDQMERKIELVSLHKTQAAIRPYMRPDHLRSTATYWGRFAGFRSVEPLEVYREVV